MLSKTVCRWGVVLVTLGLLASACTSGDAGNAADSDPGAGRTTLEVAAPLAEDDLNPYDLTSQARAAMWQTLYMPLLDTDNESQVFSNLLESWEISEDAHRVTLTLRPDIEWNDGTPVTSADVVMSLTQYLDPNISIHVGRIGGVVGEDEFADGTADAISGISAPDDLTVVVELKEPDAGWIPSLAMNGKMMPVLPHHVLGEVPHDELASHEFFETYPVTNGPYQLVEFVPDQHVEFERNPNWSLGEAGFERLFFEDVPDDVRPAQLETGEVQSIIGGVSPTDADRIGAIDGIEVQSTTGVGPYLWALTYYEPLLDPRVRQAMAFAIDREGICEQVLQGYCTVPVTNVRIVGPEWAIPTEDMIEYRYDPERARELLDEAGWDSGTELTFYNIVASNRDVTTALEIAQDNLADVGIDWTIENVDPNVMLESLESDTPDMDGFVLPFNDFSIDPSVMQSNTSCGSHYPAGANTTHYCDPEIDELWDAGRRTVSQEERAEIYHEVFRRMNRNPEAVYLFVPDSILAHDSRLKGVEVHPGAFNAWNIGEWYWEAD